MGEEVGTKEVVRGRVEDEVVRGRVEEEVVRGRVEEEVVRGRIVEEEATGTGERMGRGDVVAVTVARIVGDGAGTATVGQTGRVGDSDRDLDDLDLVCVFLVIGGRGGKPGPLPRAFGPRRGLGPSVRLVPGPLDLRGGRTQPSGGGGGGGGAGWHIGDSDRDLDDLDLVCVFLVIGGRGGKPGPLPRAFGRGLGPRVRLVPGPLNLRGGRTQPSGGGGGGGGGGGAGWHIGCPFNTHVWPGGQITLVHDSAGRGGGIFGRITAMHPSRLAPAGPHWPYPMLTQDMNTIRTATRLLIVRIGNDTKNRPALYNIFPRHTRPRIFYINKQ